MLQSILRTEGNICHVVVFKYQNLQTTFISLCSKNESIIVQNTRIVWLKGRILTLRT